jgi:hypothetical protein
MNSYLNNKIVGYILFSVIILLVYSCEQEYLVNIEGSYGLYEREYVDSTKEYLLIKKDSTYVYSVIKNDSIKKICEGKWLYHIHPLGMREIFLYDFRQFNSKYKFNKGTYIFYSSIKKRILLRFDNENHFIDFKKVRTK